MSIISMNLASASVLLGVGLWVFHGLREQRRTIRWMRDQLTKMREESNRVEKMISEAEETLKSAREAGEMKNDQLD